MFVEPLSGWRHVNITRRRTRRDFARQMKERVDLHYPHARKITWVMDNVNTHRLSGLYEAFAPAEARRIIEKIEVTHTPRHGSWLNMAECERSVLENQCLGEPIGDEPTLRQQVETWEKDRNNRSNKIDWQFTTADARIKLRRLYPKIQLSGGSSRQVALLLRCCPRRPSRHSPQKPLRIRRDELRRIPEQVPPNQHPQRSRVIRMHRRRILRHRLVPRPAGLLRRPQPEIDAVDIAPMPHHDIGDENFLGRSPHPPRLGRQPVKHQPVQLLQLAHDPPQVLVRPHGLPQPITHLSAQLCHSMCDPSARV